MKRRQFLKNTASAGILTMITPAGVLYSCKSNVSSHLKESFNAPPSSAKPFTWWHWINGNVTKDGITRDLEAMAEVGIGGFQAFSAYMDIAAGPADYLSPLWIELMQHASNESIRLGLEFDMHNCMGWSSSGGSWITPELSMQQLVWSEAKVTKNAFNYNNKILTYTGLYGDTFTFFVDYSKSPKINKETVNYAPQKVYDSPFLQSDWNSGVVNIQKGTRSKVLDFN
jgi:hypothetical protein